MVNISYVDFLCYDYLKEKEPHISSDILMKKIDSKEIMVIRQEGHIIGWLRYNLFWDNIPFVNRLFIEETHRGQGYGKLLMEFWEYEMKKRGYQCVMASTLASESVQHFYRKNKYLDAGSLLINNQSLEIMFRKEIA